MVQQTNELFRNYSLMQYSDYLPLEGPHGYFLISNNRFKLSSSSRDKASLSTLAQKVQNFLNTIDVEKISRQEVVNLNKNIKFIQKKIEKHNQNVQGSIWICFWNALFSILSCGQYSLKNHLKICGFSSNFKDTLENKAFSAQESMTMNMKIEFYEKVVGKAIGFSQVLDKASQLHVNLYITQDFEGSNLKFTAGYFDSSYNYHEAGFITLNTRNADCYNITSLQSNGFTRDGLYGVGQTLFQVALEYAWINHKQYNVQMPLSENTKKITSYLENKILMIKRFDKMCLTDQGVQFWQQKISSHPILYDAIEKLSKS
jgi:hypothetical protein